MALLSEHDLLYNIRKYYPFSRGELEQLGIAIIAMVVIVGFNDSAPTFVLGHWLMNLVVSTLVIVLAALVFISAQRVMALWWGYRPRLKVFYPGIGLGLMLTLMTLGSVPWLWWMGVHGFDVEMLEAQRLGYFRYFVRLWDVAVIAIMGPIALILLAFFFRLFYFLPSVAIAQQAVRICALYAFYQMLPIPPLAGFNIMVASRWLYFMVLAVTIAMGVFLVNAAIPLILDLVAMAVAALGGVLLYVFFINKHI